MKIVISTNALRKALATVMPAVAGKSTLPVLSCVRIAAGDGGVAFSATNLDMAITTHGTAEVIQDGGICVPAKLLAEIAGKLSRQGEVTLAVDGLVVTLTSGRYTSTIAAFDSEEFPTIPDVTGEEIVTLPGASLAALERIAGVAASDDTRPVLAGVLLDLREDRCTFAAADGFRLATDSIAASSQRNVAVIVPARTISQLVRVLDASEPVAVRLSPSGSQVVFAQPNTTVVSRMIDGKYPDYARIIPAASDTRTIINAADLLEVVERVGLVANKEDAMRLKIDTEGVTVRSVSGSDKAEERLDVSLDGTPITKAINRAYLTKALSSFGDAEIALSTMGADGAIVLRDTTYIHLIMPMTLQ